MHCIVLFCSVLKVVIQGEDTFAFEGLGDEDHRGNLPESRSVDRQKTVSQRRHSRIFLHINGFHKLQY